jgi:dolichol kinase
MAGTNKHVNELFRKVIHIGSLSIPMFYRYVLGFSRLAMFITLGACLIVSLLVDLFRIQQPTFRKFFHKLFGQILRRHERHDFTGATFLIFSCMLCVVFFNPMIAFLSMCYLSIGDTFAAIVGMRFGKRKFRRQDKTVEGSLACYVSILLFSILFAPSLSPWVYVTGSFTATLAELWKVPVDDNIKIPISSGLAMTVINLFV